MTQTEITAEYNSGVPTDLMELSAAKRPEHYYRFEETATTFPTVTDLGESGTNDGTCINMEVGDVTTDVP